MLTAGILKSILIALGIGLLIGAERERRKSARRVPATAGIRTFATASLLAALAMHLGGVLLLSVCVACLAVFTAIGYWRSRDDNDPGLTTEFALLATALLGGQSLDAPAFAVGIAVLLTMLLAARGPMHRFVGKVMTAGELADVLTVAGATFVILPLLPNRTMGPFDAINPYSMWLVVILVLGINATGRVVTRWLGARLGVPVLGLASGFVSSSATIGAMGAWSRRVPQAVGAASAAAVLSTVATFVQLGFVLQLTDQATFAIALLPILAAIATAACLGISLTVAAWHSLPGAVPEMDRRIGFALAFMFSATLGIMLIFASALRDIFGEPGILFAAAIGGVLDVHAASIAVASQVSAGQISSQDAALPLLVAWSSSAAAKIIFACAAGPRVFASRVMPAQLLIILGPWLAALLLGRI